MRRICASLLLMFPLLLARMATAQDAALANRVLGIFDRRCSGCHGGGGGRGGLGLGSREALLKGGSRGPAIVPGKPAESLLLKALRGTDDLAMPPSGRISDEDIDAVEKWIATGAEWPKSSGNAKTSN